MLLGGGVVESGEDLCKISRFSIQFNCIGTKCNNSNRKTLAYARILYVSFQHKKCMCTIVALKLLPV